MEPFSPPAAWFVGRAYPTPGNLCRRGWARPPSKGFIRINKLQEKVIYFYCLSNYFNNRSPAVGNDSQNGIRQCRRAATIYKKEIHSNEQYYSSELFLIDHNIIILTTVMHDIRSTREKMHLLCRPFRWPCRSQATIHQATQVPI